MVWYESCTVLILRFELQPSHGQEATATDAPTMRTQRGLRAPAWVHERTFMDLWYRAWHMGQYCVLKKIHTSDTVYCLIVQSQFLLNPFCIILPFSKKHSGYVQKGEMKKGHRQETETTEMHRLVERPDVDALGQVPGHMDDVASESSSWSPLYPTRDRVERKQTGRWCKILQDKIKMIWAVMLVTSSIQLHWSHWSVIMSIHVMILCDLQSDAHLQACIERDPYVLLCQAGGFSASELVQARTRWFSVACGTSSWWCWDFPFFLSASCFVESSRPHACGMHVDKELQGSIFHHALTVFVCASCQVLYCLSTQMFKVWSVWVFGAFLAKIGCICLCKWKDILDVWSGQTSDVAGILIEREPHYDQANNLWSLVMVSARASTNIWCGWRKTTHLIFLNMSWHIGRSYMLTSCTHTHTYMLCIHHHYHTCIYA